MKYDCSAGPTRTNLRKAWPGFASRRSLGKTISLSDDLKIIRAALRCAHVALFRASTLLLTFLPLYPRHLVIPFRILNTLRQRRAERDWRAAQRLLSQRRSATASGQRLRSEVLYAAPDCWLF
jgi:hypothetical protein